ncbi:MAG: tetratricopeptide repeat protein [Candidatus Moranbacteria bacterium]|nr:tetratricopeptide repeat protein [Candidatus Moranbacteria bacterium]
MWHLIIPPIVVVACFVLILWYLSLRGVDPEVAKRALAIGDAHESRIRAALRGFSLRVLEKLAQRFKVMSLRVHNTFHDFLQSVKEKRKISDSRMVASAEEHESESLVDEENDFDESDIAQPLMDGASGSMRPSILLEETSVSMEAPLAPAFSLTTPLRRRRREETEEVSADTPVVRPMVSDRAALPERPKRKLTPKPIEEDLIARIAVNPKDYTAYEALGDFYMERGSIQDAKECYRQVLKLSPVQRMVKIKIRRLERLLSQK